MILPIYIYGQPVLRKVAEDIPADYPGLDEFLKDMWDTLAESEGIGLAAPQVGRPIRVVVIDLDVLSEDMPEYHEKVARPTRIHVQWSDEKMQPHDEWVEGYLARVMQHEFDHLEGKMFVDRISPLRKQLIKSKLKSLLQGRFRCGYKTKVALAKK